MPCIPQKRIFNSYDVPPPPPHTNTFKFRIVTPVDSQSFTLPLAFGGAGYAHNFTVNWGDSSSSSIISFDSPDATHTYATAGTYDVELMGVCEYFSFYHEPSCLLVTKLLEFSNDMGFKVLSFGGCSNLDTIIPLSALDSLTTANFMFGDCTGILAIPAHMFDECMNITDFEWAFYNCTSVTSIPVGLFDNNVLATNFESVFNSCTGLTIIPTHLFDNCPDVTTFSGVFSGCNNLLLTTIPAGIFDYNTKVENFSMAFLDWEGLTAIPEHLFDNNPDVTNFWNTFYNCTNAALTSIPADLFKFNTKVTSFSQTFYGCSSLTSIPATLFSYAPDVTTFASTFISCTNLASIPAHLFDSNTKVDSFYGVFAACPTLATIPAHLFDLNTLVTDFSWAFYACIGLINTLNGNIFLYNIAVTTFEHTFDGCNGIVGTGWGSGAIPETVSGTIIYNAEHQPVPPITTGNCFTDCTSLTNYASIPVAWK